MDCQDVRTVGLTPDVPHPVQRFHGDVPGAQRRRQVALVEAALAVVVPVDHLCRERRLRGGSALLTCHVPEVVDVGDGPRPIARAVGVSAGDPGELVVGARIQVRGRHGVDAEHQVRAGEIPRVHLLIVHIGEDLAQVRPGGHDRHAAVDQRSAAESSSHVDRHLAEVDPVEHPRVRRDVAVDHVEPQERRQGRLGAGLEPHRPAVRARHGTEDLVVAGRLVPQPAHLQNQRPHPGLAQAQRRHRGAVAGADDDGGEEGGRPLGGPGGRGDPAAPDGGCGLYGGEPEETAATQRGKCHSVTLSGRTCRRRATQKNFHDVRCGGVGRVYRWIVG